MFGQFDIKQQEPASYYTNAKSDKRWRDELDGRLMVCEEYQNCIKEEENSEAEVKRKLSSKEWKLVDHYVTAVNNRWLCCGDYLYQSGMKDILLLLENS